jgi:hypothetical protein
MQDEKRKKEHTVGKTNVVGEEDVVRWSSLGGMREMGSTGRSAANTSTREHAHGGKMPRYLNIRRFLYWFWM